MVSAAPGILGSDERSEVQRACAKAKARVSECLPWSANSKCFENACGVRSYSAGLKSQLFRSLRQEFESSLGDLVIPDSKQKKKEEGKGSQNNLVG